MKSLNKIILISVAFLALIIINACELEESNINPNDPTEVPASVLLPFNEESLARLTAGKIGRAHV